MNSYVALINRVMRCTMLARTFSTFRSVKSVSSALAPTSFNSLVPVQPRITNWRVTRLNFSFLKSNNCLRKLSCTLTEATTSIFLTVPTWVM